MDIEETAIGWTTREQRDGEMDPALSPVVIYSLGFDADELLVVYASLRTYLRGLVSQDNEDFEQIYRVTKLLTALRPRAVRASKEVGLKAVGMEGKDGHAG